MKRNASVVALLGLPRPPRPPRTSGQPGLLGLLGVLGLLATACTEPPAEPLLAPTRGTILISIDTLRADFLGLYGGLDGTSPFLDSLAEKSAVFERAYAHLPGTLPSHMSLFTGLYPGEHGVYPPDGILAESVPSLPEIFSAAGYRTAGFSEGGYMSGHYGFARGFDTWNDAHRGHEDDIERTFGQGLEFLRQLDQDDRFFLFLHTYSVHDPYSPPAAYLARFWEGERPADFFEPTGPNLVQVNKGKRSLSPELLDYYRACYRASIAYMDDVLKGFFAELETLGLRDQVTFALTSDHGESFLEHGTVVHTTVYPEDLHVPLILGHPQLATGLRIAEVVESVDVPTTLLDLAGLGVSVDPPDGTGSQADPAGLDSLSGQTLRPFLEGGEVDSSPAADERSAGLAGGAYGEAFVSADQTLVRRLDGRLYQLVLAQPKIGPETRYWWVRESLAFDKAPGRFVLKLKPFHRARAVQIEIDGEIDRVVELPAGPPTPVEIRIPDDRPWARVRLSASECDIPAQVSDSKDERCLAFGLFEPENMVRFELYDLDADPLAQNDLSREESSALRLLVSQLQDIDHQARAAGESRPLDPELEARLRSLGYLQAR